MRVFKLIKAILFSLMLTGTTQAMSSNWFEEAWNDSTDWIETAWNDTWDWASHNPGLAIVASVAIVGVTEPIVLSQVAMTFIAPVYAGWTQISSFIAKQTITQAEVDAINVVVRDQLYIEGTMGRRATSQFILNSRNPAYTNTFVREGGMIRRVAFHEITQILPSNPVELASIGGVLAAVVMGSGYMIYNTVVDGVDWSVGAFNEVIIVINDSACWLANGSHGDCENFIIGEVITHAIDKNDDNKSFSNPVVNEHDDFLLDLDIDIK